MSKNGKSYPWSSNWVRMDHLDGGAQAFTFLARRTEDDPNLPPQYVLKKLKRQSDKTARSRMCAEAACLNQIDHPSVAKIIDSNATISNTEEDLYLVMEFVQGKHLVDAVENKRPTLEESFSCVLKILNALAVCHAKGVVHRDIKPHNIILRDNNWNDPVLLDFGISFNSDDDRQLTSLDDAFGNKFLKLPELESRGHNRRDPISDVTAACGILFYFLTGSNPRLLVDESGFHPQDRSLWKTHSVVKTNPELFNKLTKYFNIAFSIPMTDRWPSAISAMRSLEKIMQNDDASTGSESLKLRLDRLKDHIRGHDKTQVASQCRELFTYFQQESNRISGEIGKELSSDISISGYGQSTDEKNWVSRITWKINPLHTLKETKQIGLVIMRVDSELRLVARQTPMNDDQELFRAAIADPDCKVLMTQAIESYMGELIEGMVHAMYS
jgi:eukaryotic-like serine/threonine-protein kinase